ncbi:hypothetical protein ACTWPB_22855 [Nocardia sp. IBHARD005]|uniref:hypothetical protein n=1 Tax=Nocardia sp. IBHARD005 TaxID=3457765 RepID=UPI004057FFFA
MGELLALLLPEMIGLVVTPAAIAGCVLLLQSRRPIANALAFGGAFLLVYTQVGAAALLIAATVDFVVPIAIYLVLGERAEAGLGGAKQWMLRNNRAMSIGVLFAFGALFTIRGIANLT